MNKAIIAVPIALLLLSSCTGGEIASSLPEESDASSSVTLDDSSEASSSEEEVVFPTYDPIESDIVIGGDLTEAAIGLAFISGRDYSIKFSFATVSLEGAEVFSTHPDYMEVIPTGTPGSYTLRCKKAGDPALFIRDADGRTHYRSNIHIRDAIAKEDMEDYLVAVDHFQSWGINGGNIQLTFLGNQTALMTGYDEGGIKLGTDGIQFTYEYDTTLEDSGMYVFTILDFENPYTSLTANAFHISFAGDIIHLTNGMVGTDSFYTCEVFQLPDSIPN